MWSKSVIPKIFFVRGSPFWLRKINPDRHIPFSPKYRVFGRWVSKMKNCYLRNYVFLLQESIMYSYCCLCILIFRPCILNVVYVFLLFVHVFLTLSMYSYRCLCVLIVRPCILNVVYVFLLLSMYSYCSSMYS